MKLEWMGKYRPFVEAMVRYGNAYAQAVNVQGVITDPPISSSELQVMEYILENEERNDNMKQIAARLQISQSSFSKMVKQLVTKGLLEKYHSRNNQKNVIIRLTDHAREVYEEYANGPQTDVWRDSFALLDQLGPGALEIITQMLNQHCKYLHDEIGSVDNEEERDELIKIE